VLVIIQVKYDLTKAFTGDDDKETIHCEFDVTGGNIEWLSGQIFVNFFFLSFVIFRRLTAQRYYVHLLTKLRF